MVLLADISTMNMDNIEVKFRKIKTFFMFLIIRTLLVILIRILMILYLSQRKIKIQIVLQFQKMSERFKSFHQIRSSRSVTSKLHVMKFLIAKTLLILMEMVKSPLLTVLTKMSKTVIIKIIHVSKNKMLF